MLDKFRNIAVIGAGTMGIGIAEVAATAGHNVKLYDLDSDFAKSARQKMSDRLESRIARGKISRDLKQRIVSNIIVVSDLESLKDSDLVIEAIVENLSVKQNVFKQLQDICNINTLFASNTSSISLTAIASVLNHPENMIGLHFFNPAPVMQLVEVVAGLQSSKENLKFGTELCRLWKKVPVITSSTPGFIVNRVARPFYGEALKMLQERVTDPQTIDVAMQSCGFRMGPFRLMDLIGIDINLAVSKTVYKDMFYDPRYKPSLIQQEMVYAGRLGKKSGEGFYKYINVENESSVDFAPEISINARQNPFVTLSSSSVIEIENCRIMLTNGQSCRQRQSVGSPVAHFDLCLDYEKAGIITLAFSNTFPEHVREKVIAFIQQLGKKVLIINDSPALVSMRTVCMLMNEAADAIENGVCSRKDVDMAMQKGVNYPVGLIEWAENLGFSRVVETLEQLHQWFGDDRYRVSPWLRKQL